MENKPSMCVSGIDSDYFLCLFLFQVESN